MGRVMIGDRYQGRCYVLGYDKVHLSVNGISRLVCIEVLADEQKSTAIGI
jgi:hypothetical protein